MACRAQDGGRALRPARGSGRDSRRTRFPDRPPDEQPARVEHPRGVVLRDAARALVRARGGRMKIPDLNTMRRQHRFMSLIRPLGVIASVRQYVADRGVPQLAISSSATGNLTMAFDYIMTASGKHVGDEHLGGAGAAA